MDMVGLDTQLVQLPVRETRFTVLTSHACRSSISRRTASAPSRTRLRYLGIHTRWYRRRCLVCAPVQYGSTGATRVAGEEEAGAGASCRGRVRFIAECTIASKEPTHLRWVPAIQTRVRTALQRVVCRGSRFRARPKGRGFRAPFR